MAHIKEPKGVDFVIKSEPLTDADRNMISEHILAYKQKKNKVSTAKRKIISTKNKLVHS
jgi:hypothetical protein